MKKEIKALSFTIEEYFDENYEFLIPRYQRDYSWEIENVQTMINDFDKGYYIGNVVVHTDEAKKIKQIVDGQQRIITIFLILVAIEKLTKNSDLKEKIKKIIYDREDNPKINIKPRISQEADNLFCYIRDDNNELESRHHKYNEFLMYKKIKNKLLLSIDLEKLFQRIEETELVEISFSGKESKPHEMFVNINTKGKPLTEIEVLKSRLFQYLLDNSGTDYYKEKWQDMLIELPEKEYGRYVSDSYICYRFKNENNIEKIKTSGSISENSLKFLSLISDENIARSVFSFMTGSDKKDLYKPYLAIKNYNILELKNGYYGSRVADTSFESVNNLWKIIGEYGFKQSDILIVSLMYNKEKFISNNINQLKQFIKLMFMFEIVRSFKGVSPSNYSNSFRQTSALIFTKTDSNEIKKILKDFVNTMFEFDYEKIIEKLEDSDTFKKTYKTAKYIIMLVEDFYNLELTVEHFIPKSNSSIMSVTKLGNLIPVSKDKYKNLDVSNKLKLYKDNEDDTGICNFLKYGVTVENHIEKIDERTSDLTKKFVDEIKRLKEIIKGW